MNFDSTLGAALIGGFLTAIFFGTTIIQTFTYFVTFRRDPPVLKIFVLVIAVTDAIHMVLVAHTIYWYLITNFANPTVLEHFPTTVFGGIIVTITSDSAIRFFFARRIWILSHKNKILIFPLIVLTILIGAVGYGFGIKGLSLASLAQLHDLSWLLYTGFALVLVGDAYIAITLCCLLYFSKTGVGNTNSIINTLLAYTINTGLLTSVVGGVVVFTYVAMPNNFIFLAAYFPLSKCYVNAMLATLNARETLRKTNTNTGSSGTASSLVYYRHNHIANASTNATQGGAASLERGDQVYPLRNLRQQGSDLVKGNHPIDSPTSRQKRDPELGGYMASTVL